MMSLFRKLELSVCMTGPASNWDEAAIKGMEEVHGTRLQRDLKKQIELGFMKIKGSSVELLKVCVNE